MDKKYLIPYSCVTNVRTLFIYFIIRIFNGCELCIENSVTTVTVQHCKACREMPNSYPEWRDFQFAPNNPYGFFFLHTRPSTIAFGLEYVFIYQFFCRAEITTFFSDVNLCMWGKRLDSWPWVNSAQVSSAIVSKCFACLLGPNKKKYVCLGLPHQKCKEGQVGIFFFFFFFNKCGLFCKQHLNRYDYFFFFFLINAVFSVNNT